MLNELPVYKDLQEKRDVYIKQLEKLIVPHVLNAFPDTYDVDLSIPYTTESEIQALVVIDDNNPGTLTITNGKPVLFSLNLEGRTEESFSSTLDTEDLLKAWNNCVLAQMCARFLATEYHRTQLSGITPYLIRFQAHVKDFPVSYHAITVHVINGQSVMQSIMASMLGSAQALHPNSVVTSDDVILLGVLPYSKIVREYYSIDQWGYSIKPEALTVYARELLNVPVDL